MSETRHEFIENNRERLEAYMADASEDYEIECGFGYQSPKSAFNAILEDCDDFYLPLCFIYLFRRFQDLDNFDFYHDVDCSFILTSLESLYEIDDNGDVKDPFLAYVYAFCLCRLDKENESYDITLKLSNQCFMPAIVTMGDGCVAHQHIPYALQYYEHAIFHGYSLINGRHRYLLFKNKILPVKLFNSIWYSLKSLSPLVKNLRKGLKGEHAFYLDFYAIRHYLQKYAEIPKGERIKLFKSHKEPISNLSKSFILNIETEGVQSFEAPSSYSTSLAPRDYNDNF